MKEDSFFENIITLSDAVLSQNSETNIGAQKENAQELIMELNPLVNEVPTNSGATFSNQNHNEQILDIDSNEEEPEMPQQMTQIKKHKTGSIAVILFGREISMKEGTIKGEMKDPFSSPAKNLNQEMILIIIQILVSLLFLSVVVSLLLLLQVMILIYIYL